MEKSKSFIETNKDLAKLKDKILSSLGVPKHYFNSNSSTAQFSINQQQDNMFRKKLEINDGYSF